MKAKKIPPGGGTPSGAYQTEVESSCQQGHSTTAAAEMQEVIFDLCGEHSGVRRDELA